MVYGAIDLHMRYSQIRIIDEDGAVLRDQRVSTTRERLSTAFAGFGAMRILLERGRRVSGWRTRSRRPATRSSSPIRIRTDVRRADAPHQNGPP